MKTNMHVSLYVSDIHKTIAFYTELFEQEPSKVKPGYAKFMLKNPALVISFVENPSRVNPNFGHLGFQVATKEEVMSKLEALKPKGLVSKEEMGTACCYALQDKFWANDPDGHQWEVYYFHADSEFNDPKYSSEENEVCCIAPAEEKPAKKKVALADLNKEACCEPNSGCC